MRYAYLALFFIVVSAVSVLGFRGSLTERPPLEIFSDMDHQPKYKPQAASAFFADGRADRPTPAGAVPFGRTALAQDGKYLAAEDHLYRGKAANGDFARGFPSEVTVNAAFLERGELKYNIYCTVCHGGTGDGNGITKQYGMGATPTFHDERLRLIAEGDIYNTITHGKGNMLSYADKIEPSDRWAVIAYVRALQRAQTATPADVVPAHKSELGLK